MTNNDSSLRGAHTWNEILSQSAVWREVLEQLSWSGNVEQILQGAHERQDWIFVGCGTSFYLAESAAKSWTLLTGQRARALPASELLLFPQLVQTEGSSLQAVVISRSGSTSEALRAANFLSRERHVPTLGITCTGSTVLEQVCDSTIVLQAADEKSTVMTQSFTSMLLALQYLAARRAGNTAFIDSLGKMAKQFATKIDSLAEAFHGFVTERPFADHVFLGQGPFHGIACEAALKVMEMSCSHSQIFHTLEFRHGPKAIVSPATCLTFFLSETGYAAEAEVLAEMKELGGVTIAVCNHATQAVRNACDLVVEVDCDGNELALLAPYIVPGQLLGFFTGTGKGLDPDHPKNLTRVVILD
jgi:glucosamine--fructose-6-phosphate aminotransferase (isomerizing)